MKKKIPTILLLVFSLFLMGCVNEDIVNNRNIISNEENTPLRMTWSYYDYPKLEFSINKYYNPLRLGEEVEGILVKGDGEVYSKENALWLLPCGASSTKIDFCTSAGRLRDSGFTNQQVRFYVLMGPALEYQNIYIGEEKPLSELKKSLGVSALYVYTIQIPDVDSEGFVNIQFVNDAWCWVKTEKSEYGNNKPFCEQIVAEIKAKLAEQKENEFASNCRRNCWADPLSCTEECCPAFMEIVDEENQKTAYRMSFLPHAYESYKETGKILNCDENSLNEFLTLMKEIEE